MFTEFLGAVWRHLPGIVRRRVTRVGQRRFTVTAGVMIFDDQGRILLLDHAFRPDSGWGIPGGFLGRGEQPEEALRRELREEVGLELKSVNLAFVRTFTHRQVELIFHCQPNGDAHPRGLEVKTAAWFSIDALPEELSADQRGLLMRVLINGAKSQS